MPLRFQPTPPNPVAQDLDAFLDRLCLDWGFCSPLRSDALIKGGAVLTADRFVATLLQYEAMETTTTDWPQRLRARFCEAFGEELRLFP